MARPDEDDQWAQDPLVRALRAPGTSEELAGETEFTAAFRAAQRPRGSVRRLVGRFGIGATTAVTTVALSAGVAAAAYTSVLPDPVQRFAHGVLGPVGVPAPPHVRPTDDPRVPATTPSSTPRTPSQPATPVATPEATHAPPRSTPSAGATPSSPPPAPPSPSAPGAPVQQPGRPVPAALSVSTPSRKVAVGSVVTVSGVVTASDGRPLRNRVVGLVGRSAKKSWAKLATAKTDRNGRVELQTPALSQTTDLQLRTAHQVRSAVVRVVVLPTLDASLTQASGTSTVVVTVQGGQPGDTVSVYRRKAGKNVKVGASQVDANGTAVFSLTTPQHPVRFVFKLPADRHHGQAQTSLTVGP